MSDQVVGDGVRVDRDQINQRPDQAMRTENLSYQEFTQGDLAVGQPIRFPGDSRDRRIIRVNRPRRMDYISVTAVYEIENQGADQPMTQTHGTGVLGDIQLGNGGTGHRPTTPRVPALIAGITEAQIGVIQRWTANTRLRVLANGWIQLVDSSCLYLLPDGTLNTSNLLHDDRGCMDTTAGELVVYYRLREVLQLTAGPHYRLYPQIPDHDSVTSPEELDQHAKNMLIGLCDTPEHFLELFTVLEERQWQPALMFVPSKFSDSPDGHALALNALINHRDLTADRLAGLGLSLGEVARLYGNGPDLLKLQYDCLASRDVVPPLVSASNRDPHNSHRRIEL